MKTLWAMCSQQGMDPSPLYAPSLSCECFQGVGSEPWCVGSCGLVGEVEGCGSPRCAGPLPTGTNPLEDMS